MARRRGPRREDKISLAKWEGKGLHPWPAAPRPAARSISSVVYASVRSGSSARPAARGQVSSAPASDSYRGST